MTDQPGYMNSTDAAAYAFQLNGLLADLELWQRAHPHATDHRTTGLIQAIADAARFATHLVEGTHPQQDVS